MACFDIFVESRGFNSISPKRDLSGLIGITRRYAESQPTKWGVPPGWGLDLGDFVKGLHIVAHTKQHSNAAMKAAIF